MKPYVRIRGDLWALVTRALALDLMALGEERAARRHDAFRARRRRNVLSDRSQSTGLDLA